MHSVVISRFDILIKVFKKERGKEGKRFHIATTNAIYVYLKC